MEQVIKTIIKQNQTLFGSNPIINKINIGFTNTLYDIDNKYIVKICTDIKNEPKFKKEIYFYNNNKDNDLIPKLYYSNIDKIDVPYMYEIIEKIDGVSLFSIWHNLDEKQREEIIKQLCEAMKRFHSNKGKPYNWIDKTSDLYNCYFQKAKEKNLFIEKEIKILNDAFNKIPELLKPDDFVLVHNDLHFDNIFYKDGKIKLIDFERSIYAPKEFELDIIYRMVRKPWKFASEEDEPNTKQEDYKNIMNYIEKYYPELIHIKDLYKRLAIYDIVYYLKQYVDYPHINELKQDILKAAKEVIFNE